MEDPPQLTNGKVIPFVGIKPNELNILIKHCSSNEQIKPIIAIILYGSSSFRTFNKVLIIIDKIIRIIIKQKIKPSSSPATAKIKSVLASGIFSFKIPCPGPLPSNPPLLKAFILEEKLSFIKFSDEVVFKNFKDLEGKRLQCRQDLNYEGLMLKLRNSTYEPGRPKGPWFKFKRDPYSIDVVLLYAQRGHGKRSSFYSDYTFGVWNGYLKNRELVTVGKAYSGFTDQELLKLDKFIRANTTNRFGPVREVEKTLVLEVAFDDIQKSKRHKSGLAMRFPRIKRIRWDKPANEADTIENLERLLNVRN